MAVIAHFYCASIEYAHSKGSRTVILNAVTKGEENSVWASATPVGKLEMMIRNPLAAEVFEIGEEYELRIDRVPQSPAPGSQ